MLSAMKYHQIKPRLSSPPAGALLSAPLSALLSAPLSALLSVRSSSSWTAV